MSRFYFHLRDGTDVLLDLNGSEMSVEQAVSRALMEARALIAAEALHGRIDLDQRIDVEDEQGSLVHRLQFADAVEITSSMAKSRASLSGAECG
jgi:hypothetical protein